MSTKVKERLLVMARIRQRNASPGWWMAMGVEMHLAFPVPLTFQRINESALHKESVRTAQ